MKLKKLLAVVTVVGVLGATGIAYAADISSPAAIVSGLTGKSVESVTEERADGKTYGTIAAESDKLDEFKAEMLKQKKAILDQRVSDGTLTQAEADEIYNNMKERMALCDGTGTGAGCGMGAGLGQGSCGGLGRGGMRGGIGSGMRFGR